MRRFGGLVSSVLGVAGFIGFGLWGSFQCQIFGIDDRLNCGWVFIVMAPIGFLAGLVAGGVVVRLINVPVHGFAWGIIKENYRIRTRRS